MNRDFVEMLRALRDAGADFLIVGAQAVAAHGYVRATKDIGIWVNPTPENAVRVWKALTAFGAPLDQISTSDLSSPGIVFQIGVDPLRIDIMTTVEGIEFASAWARKTTFEEEGLTVPCLGKEDLIRTKRAAGRPHDLLDILALERLS